MDKNGCESSYNCSSQFHAKAMLCCGPYIIILPFKCAELHFLATGLGFTFSNSFMCVFMQNYKFNIAALTWSK